MSAREGAKDIMDKCEFDLHGICGAAVCEFDYTTQKKCAGKVIYPASPKTIILHLNSLADSQEQRIKNVLQDLQDFNDSDKFTVALVREILEGLLAEEE